MLVHARTDIRGSGIANPIVTELRLEMNGVAYHCLSVHKMSIRALIRLHWVLREVLQ